MNTFGKILTAMVTPFDNKGNVDFVKTTKLVNYLLENGSDGLVVSGTTGESPTLTTEEKVALFQHVVKVVDKRVPVIAGTGSNNTYASIELTKKAEKAIQTAENLAVKLGHNYVGTGLYEHFKAIASETALPIMLYNVPGRTVASIAPETTVKLSEIPNIVAIKEASGDLSAVTEIIANTSDDFSVYTGDDSLTLPSLAIGCDGVVSVASHIIGNEMQEMIEAFYNGDYRKAAKIHQSLVPVMNGMFLAPSPAPVKTALQYKGIDVGSVRLPLVPLSPQEREKLNMLINQI